MRRALALLLLLVTGIAFVACGAAREAPPPMASEQMALPAEPAMESRDTGSGDLDSGAGIVLPQEVVPDARRIVYRAHMSLVVPDAAQAMQQVEAIVLAQGGYVAQSQLSQYTGDLMRGMITVRVPVEGYQAALAQFRELGLRVLSESSDAEDVTAEYADLEAQLRNLEAAERELQALLAEVRARPSATAEDILDVYDALAEKRGEIEQVKGRLQVLANLVALSTITVELIPDEGTKPVVEEGWQPLVTLRNAARTLLNVLQGLVDVLITLVVVVLPVLAILALPVAVLVLLIRRWRRRRTPPQPEA